MISGRSSSSKPLRIIRTSAPCFRLDYMVQKLPAIIVVAPLVASFVIFTTGWRYKKPAYPLAIVALTICLFSAVAILSSVIKNGAIDYWLGGWKPPWGIAYRIDHLNAIMLVLISLLSLLAAVHAKKSIEQELPEKTTLFLESFYPADHRFAGNMHYR